MRTLLIDDMRTIPADYTARTYTEALEALNNGPWELLYLDHDLGELTPLNDGYGIACYIEQLHYDHGKSAIPHSISLVTSNSVGADRITSVLSRIYTHHNPFTRTFWNE